MFEFSYPKNIHREELMDLVRAFYGEDEVVLKEGPEDFRAHKEDVKRRLYKELSNRLEKELPWGTLTGVRPVKLARKYLENNTEAEVREILSKSYYLKEEKIELLLKTALFQEREVERNSKDVALYIGIPFCRTKCLYCSFPSERGREEDVEKYLTALKKEILFVREELFKKGWQAETIYIGGGTPTFLTESQLTFLLELVKESFVTEKLKEFSLEAGRPDTITYDKLSVMKTMGVTRTSINPQTMIQESLNRIGRFHSVEDIIKTYELAQDLGFIVNMDIIAGLPLEALEDFLYTLNKVAKMRPENITVHSLSTKRGSRLHEVNRGYHKVMGSITEKMIESSNGLLTEKGYFPYYLYRQKNQAGSQENTGYSLKGYHSLYNIRIMEEHQRVVALGAAGISKAYFEEEDRLLRIPNVSDFRLYIDRIDEMIERKTTKLFSEV